MLWAILGTSVFVFAIVYLDYRVKRWKQGRNKYLHQHGNADLFDRCKYLQNRERSELT